MVSSPVLNVSFALAIPAIPHIGSAFHDSLGCTVFDIQQCRTGAPEAIVSILARIAILPVARSEHDVDHLARRDKMQSFMSLGGALNQLSQEFLHRGPQHFLFRTGIHAVA